MIKVKFVMGIAAENWAYRPGEYAELDEVIAKAWIEAGTCVAAEEAEKPQVLNPKKK